MRKTVLTILAAPLVVVSAVQIAGAAERDAHKSDRARAHDRTVPQRHLAIRRTAELVRLQRGPCDLGTRQSMMANS